MLTLKRFFNPVQAILAATLLEDYEVFCSLFDEHVNALGFYYAMPIRLMVADQQLHRASRILAYIEHSPVPADDELADADRTPVKVLNDEIFGEDERVDNFISPINRNNPWEILAIAYLFIIPGTGFLLDRVPLILYVGGRRGNRTIFLSPFDLHLFGAVLVCVGLLLVVFYFHARNAILREKS